MARKKITAPVIDDWSNLTEVDRVEAIKNHPRWYQENIATPKLRQSFFDFAKAHLSEDDFTLVRAGTPFITDLDGALARCIEDGYDHGPYVRRLLTKRIPQIISLVQEKQKEKAELDEILGRIPSNITVKTLSIQERIADQTRYIIGHLEAEIDTFLADKCKKSKLDAKKFLVHHDVKVPQAKLIIEFLDTNMAEIKELLERKDDQLTEAYSHLTKSQQKKFYDFLSSLKYATLQRIDSVKQTRKPRKRKAKTPQQLVANLKYLDKSEDGKLTSIDPANIVGATQLWLYDTKTRFLFHYQAHIGLSVKGSTLQDFDPDVSTSKKVREQYTDGVIADVLSGGKVKLRRIMPNINAKDKEVTGRINKNQIILRAIK